MVVVMASGDDCRAGDDVAPRRARGCLLFVRSCGGAEKTLEVISVQPAADSLRASFAELRPA